MARKPGDRQFVSDLPVKGARTPPQLSEQMIAKLHAAVSSAQRRQQVRPREVTDLDGEFTAEELAAVRTLQAAIAAARDFPIDQERPASYWSMLQLKVMRHERRAARAAEHDPTDP